MLTWHLNPEEWNTIWSVFVLQILTKWGEYSNDVQFILQWSAFDGTKQQLSCQQFPMRLKIGDPLHGFPHPSHPAPPHDSMSPPDRNKDIRKSLTFSGGHHVSRAGENVGVVKARPRLEVRFGPEPFL
jgi:hypothetical protein